MGQNSWKRKHIEDGVTTNVAYQAHEDKLYVETDHNEDAVIQQNQKMAREDVYRKDMFGPGQGKLKFAFTWPNTLVKNQVHAQFPDIKSRDVDERMRAYHRMALAYPQYVSQYN